MKIIFVRHGEPNYALNCLTENEKRQAEDTAICLKTAKIDRVLSSSIGKEVETAYYKATKHKCDVEILDFAPSDGAIFLKSTF